MSQVTKQIYFMLTDEENSITRPAWTSTDLHAYKHRRKIINGRLVIEQNYYEKTGGLR